MESSGGGREREQGSGSLGAVQAKQPPFPRRGRVPASLLHHHSPIAPPAPQAPLKCGFDLVLAGKQFSQGGQS